MRISDFNKSTSGQLVEIGSGLHAFVPGKLPPSIVRNSAVNLAAEEAMNAIGELRGMATGGTSFIGTDNFIRPLLRREAVLSSKIEGTVATLRDLLAFEAAPKQKNLPEDVKEVSNYHKAVSDGLSHIQQTPIFTSHLIRGLHQTLMRNVRGEEATPGTFRAGQVFIGSPAQNALQDARFVPPPALEVPSLIDDLVKYINHAGDQSRLEAIAVAHYQFEAIHPFLDGNGRVGRLLITLMFAASGLLPTPLLHMSAFFERDRRGYYDRLLAVSQFGDWNNWLSYFFQGIRHEADDARRRILRAAEMRAALLDRLCNKQKHLPIAAQLLLDEIFRNPLFSVGSAAKAINRTIPTTQKLVKLFINEGIITPISSARRNRRYIAEGILQIYET